MDKIPIERLIFPKKSKMEILKEVLPPELLFELIKKFMRKSQEDRTIEFPNVHEFKKAVCFCLGYQAEVQKTLTWDEVMEILKGESKTLKALDISRKEVKRLYEQKWQEIRRDR